MRVTNRMMGEDFLIHLRRNLNQMHKTQNQLTTGKLFSRPSDNPVMVSRALSLETEVGRNAQYKRNIEDASGWVETTDGALNEIGASLNRLRELAIAAANGTNSDAEYKAYEIEVGQLIQGLSQIGNSKYDGRFLFGGTKTMTSPFSTDEVTGKIAYSGNEERLRHEVLPGVRIEINITGHEIFEAKKDGEDSLSEVLAKFKKGLAEADSVERKTIGGDILKQLDEKIETVLSIRSKNGATANRLEAMTTLNDSEALNLTELLSKAEDIDFAEKVMQFAMMENAYKASLSTGAKILQPTLLDYL
ncbi:MAG: flagellar hook-associated protein FlgL [Acidaminobacter sp.]|uniref:flagellar hook-associated protein FlgL n=1 Tax=Acidaminobacter sp. TaxID=1872102 RepID=UPI00137DC6E3|nr:flagellar hook-associated protein FlgL [Acidaminobacter sp.]MZQ99739.1 flagellar hook-associated protein FlgL [Acidaminobacter sp.]